LHDERRHDVGQDVPQRDAQVRIPDGARRFHVILDLDLEYRRARQAHEDRRRRDADGDHRVGEARSQKRSERDGENQKGAGEHRVGHARNERVDPAADVTGREPDGHAERERNRHGHASCQQRGARAEDHAREHVTADLVGAEPVRCARSLAHCAPARRQRVERRELRREERQQHEEDDDAERDHRAAPPRETAKRAPSRRDFAR
jgi:hypothetical protein